ncbi:MAG: cupin domain-containing protein [Burkholderiales bacterium]
MSAALKDSFHMELERLQLTALWETDAHAGGRKAGERPQTWRWRDMLPMIDQAIRAASMENTERRVLALRNPRMAEMPGPLPTINGALQILLPGEHAPPHRHSMNALRFVMEGRGATTIVDGKHCLMEEGDLILTPGWTWHEHTHQGEGRMVWFDSLDVPLLSYLNAAEFEPGPPKQIAPLSADDAFASAGMVPASPRMGGHSGFSPLFRYPWREACATLSRLPREADGSRVLHYINPLTGGTVMSLMDCYLGEYATERATIPHWSTASSICLAAEGDGVTRVGDYEVEWQRNDIFVLPRRAWVSHRARSPGAKLFISTDRGVMERLGLLREQLGAA